MGPPLFSFEKQKLGRVKRQESLLERSAISNQPGRVERQVFAVERKSVMLGRVKRQEEPRRKVGYFKPAWPSRTAGARG